MKTLSTLILLLLLLLVLLREAKARARGRLRLAVAVLTERAAVIVLQKVRAIEQHHHNLSVSAVYEFSSVHSSSHAASTGSTLTLLSAGACIVCFSEQQLCSESLHCIRLQVVLYGSVAQCAL
jgi:hypothetical protein